MPNALSLAKSALRRRALSEARSCPAAGYHLPIIGQGRMRRCPQLLSRERRALTTRRPEPDERPDQGRRRDGRVSNIDQPDGRRTCYSWQLS